MTSALTQALGRPWTVDDVARLPEDLHYELIDGRLVLPPSALPIHQFVGRQTANALDVNCPDGLMSTEDQSVLVNGVNEPRPDVVLYKESGADRTPILVADVLLAVEIISPDSTTRDRRLKASLYAAAGIPAYWLIDLLAERITFTEFLLENGEYRQNVHTDGLVTIDRPWTTTLDLPAWTQRRDRIRSGAGPNG